MGIHSFYSWLKTRFGKCIVKNVNCDNLLFDLNGIFHTCAQQVYNYGPNKRLLEDEIKVNCDDKLCMTICNEIDKIIFKINPRKTIVFCVDGPAPAAKMMQQRSRRFRNSNDKVGIFDTCSISPGTPFMYKLDKYILKYINMLKADNPKLKIIYSNHLIPSEGEHKLLNFIRNNKNSGVCHIFTPDSDLVMLCLGVLKNNLYIVRELNGYVISIDIFKKMLVTMYGWDNCDINNFCLDFILLFFLFGNDFIPKIPTLHIVENSMERIFDIYKAQINLGYLIQNGNQFNIKALKNLLSKLGSYEEEMINYKLNNKRAYYKDSILEDHTIQTETELKVDFNNYKKAYNKYKVGNCKNYIQGLWWIFNYYLNGIEDWEWHYPYYYAPFCSDIAEFLDENSIEPIVKTNPPEIYVQLISILPKSSFNLLPEPFNKAYLDPEIELYFPDNIDIDYDGKYNEWEGIPLLPHIDIQKVKNVYFNLNKQILQ